MVWNINKNFDQNGINKMTILLDSVIIIDHFNQIKPAKDFLENVLTISVISVITRAEVLTDFRDNKNRANAIEFLELFPLLDITKPIVDLAAILRQQHGWKLPDALQAAAAQHHKDLVDRIIIATAICHDLKN